MKYDGSGRRAGAVLLDPAPVGEVDGEDLASGGRREVAAVASGTRAVLGEDDPVAVAAAPALLAVDLDADARPSG